MIKYIRGDLLESNANVIAHGCNAVGGFGSGVAGQIAKKWPKAKQDYLNAHKDLGLDLGWVYYSNLKQGLIVAHCVTQYRYLPRGICHANYEAIESCMETLKVDTPLDKTIAMPKIGAGLAGGDWQIIEAIINKVFDDREILVYTLD